MHGIYKVKYYPSRSGNYPVKGFIDQLDKKSQAKIFSHITLLQEQGPQLHSPYVEKVTREIWCLRTRTLAGYIRTFYFFFKQDVILLHSFKKKTPKIPKREIKTAEGRMEDFRVRYEKGEFK